MVVYFFPEGWALFQDELRRAASCVLVLDYDGTLTPIVRHPRQARLSSSMRKLLEELSRKRGIYLGILSGRRLEEVRRLVGVSGIFYAGNHGFEFQSEKKTKVLKIAQETRPLIRRLALQLSRKLEPIPGAWVEDKGFTLSVHYRNCPSFEVPMVLAICNELTQRWRAEEKIRVTEGKKVYEIRPGIEWDKGKALEWFLRNLPSKARQGIVVYLGDDTTDEDAFRVVRERKGWGIRVGEPEGPTQASYHLRGIQEVRRFLFLLLHPPPVWVKTRNAATVPNNPS